MVPSSQDSLYFRQQGAGPATLLFLHGNLSSSLWWEKVFGLLPPSWRAIAPDLRGYGRSPAFAETKDFIGCMAADIATLYERLALPSVVLIGHSLGGAVALQFALENPRRVQAMVLVDPVPAGGLHLPAEVFDLLNGMKSSRSFLKEGLRASAPNAPDDAFFDSLVEEALRAAPQAFREIPQAAAEFNVRARLRELACPTLCVMGENDLLIPKQDVLEMSSRIRNSTFVEMPGVGHCPNIEAPEKFTRLLLDFVASQTPHATA